MHTASPLTVKNQNQKSILIPSRRSLSNKQTANIRRIISSIPLSTPVDLQTPLSEAGFCISGVRFLHANGASAKHGVETIIVPTKGGPPPFPFTKSESYSLKVEKR